MSIQRIHTANKSGQIVVPPSAGNQQEIIDVLTGVNAVNVFNEEATVLPSTETTIVTYVVPASKILKIVGISGTGAPAARFTLTVGGTAEAIVRMSSATRVGNINFDSGPISVTAGTTVLITGFHEASSSQPLAANLFGFLIDA